MELRAGSVRRLGDLASASAAHGAPLATVSVSLQNAVPAAFGRGSRSGQRHADDGYPDFGAG